MGLAGGGADGVTVAAWGLTFKAGTDDLRDSPALAVLRRIEARGGRVRAYDPTLPEAGNGHLKGLDLTLAEDPYTACSGADVLVILTEWPELRKLDLVRAATAMARPAVVDTRNMLDPAEAKAAGFTYLGRGRS
jgi:UDPglucose 6-dehydrogenase